MKSEPTSQSVVEEQDALSPERHEHVLSLDKKGHAFRLQYETGQESQVLESLSEMVANPALPFDWFDAAMLGHQMGGHLVKELGDLMPKKAA